MPLKKHIIAAATVLAVAVGLATASGASATPIPNPFYQYTFHRFVDSKCSVDPDSAAEEIRSTVRMKMGTYANKRNNLRKMSLQARMIPADSGTINYYYAWGRTKTVSRVSADGDNNALVTVKTPSVLAGQDYHVQLIMKWDRKLTADWEIKERYQVKDTFCAGGSFPGGS